MKKLILPIIVFLLGLAVAQQFFGVNVTGLTEGFIDFLADILDGPSK